MKIGIITFHRAHNYGAVLQCYALQQTLQKISGLNVDVIDYRQPYIEDNYAVFSWRQFFRKMRSPGSLKEYIQSKNARVIRKGNFESFGKKYLHLTERCSSKSIPSDYDTYIVGSDQLWATNHVRGMDKVYFGQFSSNSGSKKYTYAISSNRGSLEFLGKDVVKEYANSFEQLSFREKSIGNIVSLMTGRECRQDIDPVLLTKEEDWEDVVNNKWASRNYILVYQIGAPEGNHKLVPQKAEEIAKSQGWEVIDVTSKMVSPEDFVSLFKYAKMVLTTSFHGTAFSILFRRPFYTIKVNPIIDLRAKNLLEGLDISNRQVELSANCHEMTIDYGPVHSKLSDMQQESLNYLKLIIDETVSRCK